MSLIHEYRSTEEAIKELQARLDQLSASDELKKDIKFEKKLRDLMAEHGKSLRDIQDIIDPQPLAKQRANKSNAGKGEPIPRKARAIKQYRNPNTGEVIETKGGNHKGLKEWKAQYGSDVVEGWVTLL